MFGTQHFVLCREVVLFRRLFYITCVYMCTISLSIVWRFVLIRCVLYQRFHCNIFQAIQDGGTRGLRFTWLAIIFDRISSSIYQTKLRHRCVVCVHVCVFTCSVCLIYYRTCSVCMFSVCVWCKLPYKQLGK